MIKRHPELLASVTAHKAVGRLQSDCSTVSRGDADRSARIGADCDRNDPRGHGCSRATARPTRDTFEAARIVNSAIMRIVRCNSVSKLVQVRLADYDGACCF